MRGPPGSRAPRSNPSRRRARDFQLHCAGGASRVPSAFAAGPLRRDRSAFAVGPLRRDRCAAVLKLRRGRSRGCRYASRRLGWRRAFQLALSSQPVIERVSVLAASLAIVGERFQSDVSFGDTRAVIYRTGGRGNRRFLPSFCFRSCCGHRTPLVCHGNLNRECVRGRKPRTIARSQWALILRAFQLHNCCARSQP
jgi:hypothetical protein